ncbi:MAG TPA: hypothetical protein VEO53_13750, partial [Candidatus Binatia bacterium]|nr:hypothetical protein [Candidatus Binatia bacterium]
RAVTRLNRSAAEPPPRPSAGSPRPEHVERSPGWRLLSLLALQCAADGDRPRSGPETGTWATSNHLCALWASAVEGAN